MENNQREITPKYASKSYSSCASHILSFCFISVSAAGVVPCGDPKKSPRTSSIVQAIFSFCSFEISEDIQNTRNLLSVKIHFPTNV